VTSVSHVMSRTGMMYYVNKVHVTSLSYVARMLLEIVPSKIAISSLNYQYNIYAKAVY
jgi:hypothetical protein